MAGLRTVLVMTDPPLPFGNAAARWYYVLTRGLAQRGHRMTAFVAGRDPAALAETRSLFPDLDLRLYSYPDRNGIAAKTETLWRPHSYMFSRAFRRDLDATLAEGFDVLHLEHLWSGWVGLRHVERALLNIHFLFQIDFQIDQEAWCADSWRARFDRQMALGVERRLLRTYRHVRTVSPRLSESVARINPIATVHDVPIGLDLILYPFREDEPRPVGDGPVVALIGSMGWKPTRSAAARLLSRLWPEIKRRVPDAQLRIVGWSARALLPEALGLPDVTVVENVPDIQPEFARANVLLYAPGLGSGMKVKVLEAMAFGVPVVTTAEGIEGLPAADGRHAGVCEDDAGLIERTVALLRDPARQARQRLEARRLLAAHCGAGPTLDALEAVYARMPRTGGT